MNHLDRYIVREHVAPFFISNALILFIFTLNLALQMLGRIVGKGLDPMLIAEFFFLNLAWIITLSVPMSVLVACLMAFGRLAGDHEIVAMKAAGLGINRMIRPVLAAGLLVTAFSLYFQDQVLPDMNHRNKLLTTAIKRRQPNVVLREGTFTREIPKQTLLVRSIDEGTDTLRNVTIFDESNQNQPTTILGERGKMTFVDTLGMFQFKLFDGEIHQTEREDPSNYQVMEYGEALFRIESTDQVLQRQEKGYRGDRELGLAGLMERVDDLRARPDPSRYTRQINRYLVEYHKKWSISFAAIVFVLVGAPLGIKLTHGGLGVSGPLSVVFFLLYWTFLIGGEDIADRGIAPPWLAMWAPNILLGLMGWGLIFLETRQHSSFRFPWQRRAHVATDDKDTGWSDLSQDQLDRMAAEERAKAKGDEAQDVVTPVDSNRARTGSDSADATPVSAESRPASRHGAEDGEAGNDLTDDDSSRREGQPDMYLIDRYVARRFIVFFGFSILAALSVYLIVDPIENLDKFIDKNIPWSEIGRYYALYVPFIIYQTYPVAVLLGTMFCIGGLTTKNELQAMTASGIPLLRHLMLLVGIGFVLSVFMFWFGETVVPEMNRERLSIWRQQVKQREDWRLTDQGQVYLQDGPGRVLHLDIYQPKIETAYGVDLYEFNAGQITKRINARQMRWDKSRWVLERVVLRDFGPEGERVQEKVSHVIELTVKPEDLVELQVEPEEMSMEQLKRFADRIESTGGDATRWHVDIHSKVSLPFAGVIIILFGVPVSAVRRRSGVIFGVMISLMISFVFFGILNMGKVYGYRGMMDPWLAAWAGNIIFFVVGIGLYFRAPR